MPLNPPSYIGHDVWYSPDVYVNQVPVALWQPAQNRAIPETLMARMNATFSGEDLQFQDPSFAANQGAAFTQKMVKEGLLTQEQVDEANAAKANGSEASTGGLTSQPGNISTDTQGVENLKAFSPTLQLSRNFTLGQLTDGPYVVFPQWTPRGIVTRGNAGLTPGQLVANAKLLAVNCLDLIKNKYPDMIVTSTVRVNQGNPNSQHIKFQACDFQRPRGLWNTHFEVASWIQKNVPFDQLLLEYTPGVSWIHVSFAQTPTKKIGDPYKVAVMNATNNSFPKLNGLVNLDSQFRIS